jgi:predicted nuclease of predicted toxin-antitoxin system
MRFLVDECAGPAVARWLRDQGHEVFSVFDEDRGADDDVVLQRAWDEDRILITIDKDFGDKVYREQRPHRGVILLRLDDERAANKLATLEQLLAGYADQLAGQFVVVTATKVRFARTPGQS